MRKENQGQKNSHNVTRQNDDVFIAVAHVIPPRPHSPATTPQTSSDAEISHEARRCDSTNDSGGAEWEELSRCMTALSQSRPSCNDWQLWESWDCQIRHFCLCGLLYLCKSSRCVSMCRLSPLLFYAEHSWHLTVQFWKNNFFQSQMHILLLCLIFWDVV